MADDSFYLSDKNMQLGHGVFGVGGNGQAFGAPHHEVVLPADEKPDRPMWVHHLPSAERRRRCC